MQHCCVLIKLDDCNRLEIRLVKLSVILKYFFDHISDLIVILETNVYVIGGNQAAEGDFEYQVSLQYNLQHFCGAAIIGARYVLTTAHCQKYSSYQLKSGTIDYRAGVTRHMEIYTKHPNYNPSSLVYGKIKKRHKTISFQKYKMQFVINSTGQIYKNFQE